MEQQLIHLAQRAGAYKAEALSGEQIVTSADFRTICEGNGCGRFGRCWMCPPHVGDIHALMDELRRYPRAILYQTVGNIEDSFDIEGMEAVGKRHIQVSQTINEGLKVLLPGQCLHLSKGSCGVCESCAILKNLPCRFPGKALPSLEAYGVDVYQTSRATSLRYINGQNTVTFFGMILFGA